MNWIEQNFTKEEIKEFLEEEKAAVKQAEIDRAIKNFTKAAPLNNDDKVKKAIEEFSKANNFLNENKKK